MLAETMMSVDQTITGRVAPWMGLGTVVKEAPNSHEALKLAGLDWKVNQEELIYKGQKTGYRLNVRDKDDKVLGVVGGRFTTLQNDEAFAFTDELIGNDVRYETAGSLSSGKRVWILAKMPEKEILDEQYEPYLCLSNNHDGSGSLKVFMTPIRVWCQNTLNLALKKAQRTWTAQHSKSLTSKVEEAKRTLEMASKYMDALQSDAEELYKIKVAPATFNQLTDTLFPIPEDAGKRKEEAQLKLRDNLRQAWAMDDLNNIRGTAWGFLNAVSDMSTHKEPARKTENYRENQFMNILDYPTLLDQATKMVRELA